MSQGRAPWLCLALAGLWLGGASPARAERTKLLEVDLKTGKRKNIDGAGPKSQADKDLDAMLDGATGGSAFSTRDLEKIEQALRRYLQAARPRAMPRLLLFLYPGRVSKTGLKELREVLVEIELFVDPCGRTVCQESVAQHIELLGRSMQQAVIRTSRYTVRFQSVVIRATADLPGHDVEVYRFGAEAVVESGRRKGGGLPLVSRIGQAKQDYDRDVTKEVVRRVKLRRVTLVKPPEVRRDNRSVTVALEIASDRTRYKTHVTDAFAGAAEALGKNPLTPSSAALSVVAQIQMRGLEKKHFSCTGQPLSLYLAGRISLGEIWQSYIVEKAKGGKQLAFSDDEAAGGQTDDEGDDGDDRTPEILAAHFNLFAPCLQAEAGRNRRFRGATLKFSVTGSGQATSLSFAEAASAGLRQCLQGALSQVRFPRHSGAPRQVQYPLYIQR